MKRFLGDLLRWAGIVTFSLQFFIDLIRDKDENPSFSGKQAMPSTPMNQRP